MSYRGYNTKDETLQVSFASIYVFEGVVAVVVVAVVGLSG